MTAIFGPFIECGQGGYHSKPRAASGSRRRKSCSGDAFADVAPPALPATACAPIWCPSRSWVSVSFDVKQLVIDSTASEDRVPVKTSLRRILLLPIWTTADSYSFVVMGSPACSAWVTTSSLLDIPDIVRMLGAVVRIRQSAHGLGLGVPIEFLKQAGIGL